MWSYKSNWFLKENKYVGLKYQNSQNWEIRQCSMYEVHIPSHTPSFIVLYFMNNVNMQSRKIQSCHPVSFVSKLHNQSKIPQLIQFGVNGYMFL
jgi:hypothetical protein